MSVNSPLIALPADQLLARFGDDKPTPGSGCAAALMGLLAASLICAVARLTLARANRREDRDRAKLILDVVETRIVPELKSAFQQDADIFDQVIALRLQRDTAVNDLDRRRLAREATSALKPATEILFQISDRCFELIDNGIALYGSGYKAARGDTGAALSAAAAGISSIIFVVSLNAKTSKAAWALEAMSRVGDIRVRLNQQQQQIFALIRQSGDEALQSIQLSFEGGADDQLL